MANFITHEQRPGWVRSRTRWLAFPGCRARAREYASVGSQPWRTKAENDWPVYNIDWMVPILKYWGLTRRMRDIS